MKTRIAVGAALLLTLGSAVAGMYVQGRPVADDSVEPVATVGTAQQEVTPEMIAMWKSTASSSDYVVPRRPI